MTAPAIQSPPCPQCGSEMWDETKSKFYKPGKPIWKCKNAGCKGVIWAPKNGVASQPTVAAPPRAPAPLVATPLTTFQRLNSLFELHDLCLAHALGQSEMFGSASIGDDDAEAISSRAATIFIQACRHGLAG